MFVLKHKNGTYYRGRFPIGPMFGATLDEALRFEAEDDAAAELVWHWAMGDAEIDRLPDTGSTLDG